MNIISLCFTTKYKKLYIEILNIFFFFFFFNNFCNFIINMIIRITIYYILDELLLTEPCKSSNEGITAGFEISAS